MALWKIVKASSRQGQKLLEKLEHRGEGFLDEAFLDRAARIVETVRRGGDTALVKAVRRYDGVRLASPGELRRRPESDPGELPSGFREALDRAVGAVERYHERQVHEGFRLEAEGVELQERRQPLGRVGVYVPGGRAAYPSSMVMAVVPARLAGVGEIAIATPPATWDASAALRYTVARLGVEEVYGMGGAHAVAALAYGTESIPRVDKIVGPGNAWVTAAKHLVTGDVAIDGIAGPSEVVIVADREASPELVAADLLAQAEHDPQALAVLVTDENRLAKDVGRELRRQLDELATAEVARAALAGQGAALVVTDMEEALDLVETIAPEHLQLVGSSAEALVERIRNAGAIFVGAATPEVFGDYVAGPNHILPTVGTARFASALGVEDFVRRSHVVRFATGAAARWAAAAATLADVEGLPAHAAAARKRLRFDEEEP